MEYAFEKLGPRHRDGVLRVFNYYILNSTAAYREERIGDEHYRELLNTAATYPAFAIVDSGGEVVGFCRLKPHSPLPTFSETAELTYFLDPRHTGKGLGTAALSRLESAARSLGVRVLLASISSENEVSLSFHRARGFVEYGRFPEIIKKFGRRFAIVWMGKVIE